MKKSTPPFVLLCLIISLSTWSHATLLISGRGNGINVTHWQLEKGTLSDPQLMVDQAEVYCTLRHSQTGALYIGGTLKDKATVWIQKATDAELQANTLNEGRIIYSLAEGPDGTVYAAGSHYTSGGGVWEQKPGQSFDKGSFLYRSSLAYTVTAGPNGTIYAGGIGGSGGRVWMKKDGKWSVGNALHQSREITSMVATHDKILAAGIGVGPNNANVGAYWIYDGESWKVGQDLKFAHAIYATTVTKEGVFYLAGAGDEGRVIWENSKGFWNALPLDNCLAIYSIRVDKQGTLICAGWNNGRRGKVWWKTKGDEWQAGLDVPDCFVVRATADSL